MAGGFRNALIVPVWLSNRPGLQVGFKLLWSIATICDTLIHGIGAGLADALPGIADASSSSELGVNRGIVQGPSQTNDAFATELIDWRALWRGAGSDEALCVILQNYIPGTPTVRVVNRASRWVSLIAGTFSYVMGQPAPSGAYTAFTYLATAAFRWDSLSNPARSGDWSDIWIVVSTPPWPAETRTLAQLDTAYTTFAGWAATGWGVGMQVPRAEVNAILAAVKQWTAPHCNPRCIVFDYTGGWDPTAPMLALDYCGPWAFGEYGYAPTPQRPSGARYWVPSYGSTD